jgi:serine protease Do
MKTTTHLFNRLKGLIGVASIALAIPVLAIENPADEATPKEKRDKKTAAVDDAPNGANEAGNKAEKKRAMLGLGGVPASETLSLHLGLDDGSGLTVYHVVPGSAAAKAGLETHDVLIELDGQDIGSQQNLRNAVLAHKPGDEITVKYIHKGKIEQKKIVLGERGDRPRVPRVPEINPRGRHGAFRNFPEADRKRIKERMHKHMERLQNQLNDNGGMQLDLHGLFDNGQKGDPENKGAMRGTKFKFGSAASITMMDEDGSVTLKTIDGKKEVIVKDKKGKVVYEGPYQTDQDKSAVPDDIRDRLERMNLEKGGNGGLRLQVGPGGIPGGIIPPEPPEDEAVE